MKVLHFFSTDFYEKNIFFILLTISVCEKSFFFQYREIDSTKGMKDKNFISFNTHSEKFYSKVHSKTANEH